MAAIEFIVMGDIHLAPYIWSQHREIANDGEVAFTSLVDIAIELKVPFVIAGDVFDSTEPPPSLVRFFRAQMARCEAAGIPVFAFQGNHDKRQVPWYVAASAWPVHIGHGQLVQIGRLSVLAYDYDFRGEIEAKMAALAASEVRPQVLMLHQAAKQALKFEGAWNFDLDWVPDGIPLVIMGDIHKQVEMAMRNGGRAWYTGASHPRSIEEFGPKSCLAVSTDLHVQPIEIDYRSMEKFTLAPGVDSVAMIPEVVTWVERAIERGVSAELKPVLWVRHTDDQAPALQALIEALARFGDQVITVTDPMLTSSATGVDTREVDTSGVPTMTELLARVLDPEQNRFAFQLVTDLLSTDDNVQDRLRAQRDAFLASLKRPNVAVEAA